MGGSSNSNKYGGGNFSAAPSINGGPRIYGGPSIYGGPNTGSKQKFDDFFD